MFDDTNQPLPPPAPASEFKPNIYPIMYWAIAFGAVAGIMMFVLQLLSQYIGVLWFPVFLAGLIWGGYRNYQKQKETWAQNTGIPASPGTPWSEFRQAAGDIASASRDLMEEESKEPPEPAAPPAPPPPPQPPAPPSPPVQQ